MTVTQVSLRAPCLLCSGWRWAKVTRRETGTPPFPERLDLLEERDWASVRDPKCLRPEPVSGFWPGKVPGAEQWVPLSFLKGFGDEPTPN